MRRIPITLMGRASLAKNPAAIIGPIEMRELAMREYMRTIAMREKKNVSLVIGNGASISVSVGERNPVPYARKIFEAVMSIT
jgi:hypothetical protein